MMLALPAHTEAPAEAHAQSEAYSMDTWVQELIATPKEDTSGKWEQPAPEPKPAPAAPENGPKAESASDHKASAKEFIDLYDLSQSYGFHFYSGGADQKQFALDAFPKERAVHHLAKGLEKMGGVEVPWYLGLILALAPAAFANYLTAVQYRRAQADAKENAERQKRSEPVHPSSITMPTGEVVPAPQAKRSASGPMPQCSECGTAVKNRRNVTCGQSCAAKRTNRLRADKNKQ